MKAPVLPALTHFSSRPLVAAFSVDQAPPQSAYQKPRGLWVSVEESGDGWSDFCRDERFALNDFVYETAVDLRPEARVLHLQSASDLEAFTQQFVATEKGYIDRAVDWCRVAGAYQAILISPYVWEWRLHAEYTWYYTWDCASGCIWDADAIASLKSRRSDVMAAVRNDLKRQEVA